MSNFILKTLETRELKLNTIRLRGFYGGKLRKGSGGGGSGDGFPQLPGDVTRWHFGGLTNEMMAAMDDPRIEDADHKGRFLSFKNFAWSGMSGCGGYSLSKEIFSYTPAVYSLNFTEPDKGIKEFDVYFQLIDLDENSGVSFNLDIRESGTAKRIKRETYTKDGIYHFEYKSEDDATNLYMIGYNGVGEDRTTFTVKILPYYAGALVFDGVDDYGICENFPILTKEKGYTVVALRKWLTPENKTNNEVLVANLKEPRWITENWGAFGCEVKYNNVNPKVKGTMSFGNTPVINVNENNVLLCQTSNNYNGVDIVSGNNTSGPYLLICSGGTSFFAKAAIWELIILDHDATEEELTKIKNYFVKTYPWLFFDQAWTVVGKSNEDTDRATIANITGNGNNLVLSNFGFARNSGYGEYAYNWSNISEWIGYSNNATFELTSSAIHITEAKSARPFLESKSHTNGYNKMKIKVTGIKTGEILRFASDLDPNNAIIIETDGNYSLPGNSAEYYGFRLSNSANTYPFNCDITIEQIPDHEGYLVTDGVDDGVSSLSVIENIKDFTWVGEFIFPQYTGSVNYVGIQKPNDFILYNCYNSANKAINAFINGTTNNKLINKDTVKAVCSEGLVYDENWNSIVVPVSTNINTARVFSVGYNPLNNNYGKMLFKNIGRIPRKLSKEDSIKAYIYLQTLKAK